MKSPITRISQQTSSTPLSVPEPWDKPLWTWLAEITRPASADSNATPTFDFALFDNDIDHAEAYNVNNVQYLYDAVKMIGQDPKQVIVENDTVDFNVHYSPTALLSTESTECLPLYSISDNVFGICWTFDPIAVNTKGVLWYRNDEGHRQCSSILEGLSRLHSSGAHEMLPALLTLQAETTEMRSWVNSQAEQIMACQIKTGYHYYVDSPFYDEERSEGTGFAEVSGNYAREVMEMDIAMMTKKICGLAINISTSTLCLRRLVQVADFVLDQMAEEPSSQSSTSKHTEAAQPCVDANHFIATRTRSEKRRAEGILAETVAWQQKSQVVVQTLMSLTTQRDQHISISIAEDSRTLAQKATRDSQSMKAIAAVTMVFLPGTFIASMFAMPMFAWDVSSDRTVSRNFWIYWAVTLPLTALVVVVWLVSTNRELFRHKLRRVSVREKSEV